MLGGLEDARDDLDLAPGDPIADYVDEILGNRVDHNTEHLLDAMREENQRLAEDARKSLEALRNARGQGRHVRRDLDRARRELRELEDDLEQATAPDPRVGELQDRVETLELAAQRLEVDKHALRAELSGMEQRLASRGGPGSAPDDDAFDQDALPPSFEHVLVPDWSPPARAAIAELDGNLAARALDIVTHVASGRAGEGARVKKLKGTEDLWSARLGIAHRILFRFDTPARALRVADVIARRELDKVLRRLG
jgi:chaperonin cofactor prefoldin